ncbi:GlxA family transcriptional regulator [Litorimonas sp. RW-G-Af-16]|uniref:GlxA family transcriptional regulator n=1 Tax=Litorimonas sp. RW-G-Af-16 TaxID=3241168 RepID=UPI00390C6C37
MFGHNSQSKPQRIGFLLLPEFSMIAFTACIEPLRAANRLSREPLYEWTTLSLDGLPVTASNRVKLTPDGALRASDCDAVFVCAGLRPVKYLGNPLRNEIRSLVRRGKAIGAVCTGSFALADAGVLTGYRCTIHWEDVETFKEVFPNLDITATLFEIDRNRYTCSGGTAPLDMMIYSIKLDHGSTLALNVAEQMLHNFVREPQDNQRMAIEYRTGITHPKLLAAIGYMEAHTENPISLERLASEIDISVRQLERLFQSQLSTTPARYYLNLRLNRARQFLRRTTMSILEVGFAAGFNSSSHFSQAYKKHFGHSPNAERL